MLFTYFHCRKVLSRQEMVKISSRREAAVFVFALAVLLVFGTSCSHSPTGSVWVYPSYICDEEQVQIHWDTSYVDRVKIETAQGGVCVDTTAGSGTKRCRIRPEDTPLTATGYQGDESRSLKFGHNIVFCQQSKWTEPFEAKERCNGEMKLELLPVVAIDHNVEWNPAAEEYRSFDVPREEIKGLWYQRFDGFYVNVDPQLFSDQVVLLKVMNDSVYTLIVTGPNFGPTRMEPGAVVSVEYVANDEVPKPGGGWSMLYEEPEWRLAGYQDFELADSYPITVCMKKHANIKFFVRCADM